MPKKQLEKLVKECNSLKEVALRLGYSGQGSTSTNIRNFLVLSDISISHFTSKVSPVKYTSADIFCENSIVSRSSVKRNILKNNLIPYECAECEGKPTWNNKKLCLILDHVNGINNDHRLVNLRFLCPNCNSQTETFSSKNKHKYSVQKYYEMKKKNDQMKRKQEAKEKKLLEKTLKETESVYVTSQKLKMNYKDVCAKAKKHEIPFEHFQNFKKRDFSKSKTTKNKLIKLLKEHKTITQVSKVVGLSDVGIIKRCKKYGIDYKKYNLERNKFLFLEPQLEKIKRFYEKNGKLTETAIKFKTKPFHLKLLFKKHNIPLMIVTVKNSPEKLKKIVELIEKGYTTNQIISKLDVKRDAVKHQRKRLNKKSN